VLHSADNPAKGVERNGEGMGRVERRLRGGLVGRFI